MTLALSSPTSQQAHGAPYRDLYSDTWVATDALGRTMPTFETVGPPKKDQRRVVGIFYITWHSDSLHNGFSRPFSADVSRILAKDPTARLDGNHPLWKDPSYHWGEPEFGYFLSKDEWVIRRDMSMLSDAGVDVLVMDVTNAVCYWDEWDTIFKVMQKMKAEGNKVPQFCFWAFNGPVITVVQDLYDRIYKPGKYRDLWFYWDGKPLLLYNGTPFADSTGQQYQNPNRHYDPKAKTDPSHPHYGDPDYAEEFYKDYTKEVKQFFTLRTMWWGYYQWAGKRFVGTEDNWSFGYDLAHEPVKKMNPADLLSTHKGKKEQAAVTPARDACSAPSQPRRQELDARAWRAGAERIRPTRPRLCPVARQDGLPPRGLRHLLPAALGRGHRRQPPVPLPQRLERMDRRQVRPYPGHDLPLHAPSEQLLLRGPI